MAVPGDPDQCLAARSWAAWPKTEQLCTTHRDCLCADFWRRRMGAVAPTEHYIPGGLRILWRDRGDNAFSSSVLPSAGPTFYGAGVSGAHGRSVCADHPNLAAFDTAQLQRASLSGYQMEIGPIFSSFAPDPHLRTPYIMRSASNERFTTITCSR
jgi:hypothetical protein